MHVPPVHADDGDGDGRLDRFEMAQAARELGLGEHADFIFKALVRTLRPSH